MGDAVLNFKPRESLTLFVKEKGRVSLIRRISGKKSSKNMAIHGENLATLAGLKAGSGTSGKHIAVDLIYIDPPYNVGGNQGYRNIWKGKSEKERDWAGDHGAFLDFMEPRIKIGKSLLTDDGIMFVSICDGEYCRLKILMDQIFGSENCLGTIIWNKRQGPSAKHLSTIHEYVLVYAKDSKRAQSLTTTKPGSQIILEKAKSLQENRVKYAEAQKIFCEWINEQASKNILTSGESFFKYLHPETFRPFKAESTCAQDKPESRCHDPLIHPITGKPCKVPKNGWKWKRDTLIKMLGNKNEYIKGGDFSICGKFIFGKDENTVPRQIYYLDDKLQQILPTVIDDMYCVGHNDLPEGIKFSTPKPVKLIKRLIESFHNKSAIVLDFFAGSGSTAQAVYELNGEDGGNRSWIMIEELGSTFHNTLIPRIDSFDTKKDYAIYETDTADISNRDLIKNFQKYSFDYLAAYHRILDTAPVSKEGLSILGIDDAAKRVVAMTIPTFRKNNHFFEEELALLKDAIKKNGATSALIYTVNANETHEEPWIGVDKSVLSGTQCKQLQIVEVPDKLVKEWEDVLAGMEAA